ncbi:hypothetical protein MnTg03_00257 [bacterium MnTg03]|nr:hypothetical protein MnTg03_00257 [bacterium MnTg03]
MLINKFYQALRVSTDAGFDTALWKISGVELFVTVPKAGGFIDHQRTAFLGLFEQISTVDIFEIKRRVFTHQNDIELVEAAYPGIIGAKPVLVVVFKLQQLVIRVAEIIIHVQIINRHVINFPAAMLRFQ